MSDRIIDGDSSSEHGTRPSENPSDDHSAKRALDELFTMTSSYRSGAQFGKLLDFITRFRFYSPFNATLVHIQKPGATFVAPAHRWRRSYGRRIKFGAQPLVILQPMGPVMFVFDVSDTEGDPLPDGIENPFEVRRGRIGEELERTIKNSRRDGIHVTMVRLGSQQAGALRETGASKKMLRLDDQHEVELRYEMTLNENHSRESQYATLVHELAHVYCGHLGTPNEKWWPDRRDRTLETREFEAESVAYLVCRRRGIDPRSDEYLSGYKSQEGDIPPISLELVVKVAGLIERMGREKLKPRKAKSQG